MKILAFLQNQWFKDPERVRAIYARRPEHRQELNARFLFFRSLTGRRLKQVFGDLTEDIIWENASPEIGGKSSAVFKADLDHVLRLIEGERPDVILTFGKIATSAIFQLKQGLYPSEAVISPAHVWGPHPAARHPDTLVGLKEMERTLQRKMRLIAAEVHNARGRDE